MPTEIPHRITHHPLGLGRQPVVGTFQRIPRPALPFRANLQGVVPQQTLLRIGRCKVGVQFFDGRFGIGPGTQTTQAQYKYGT